MPMITPFILKLRALMTSFCDCKILLRNIFSGFLITKWKETPFTFDQKKTQLDLGDSLIRNSNFEKLLGVIDNKLRFHQHIKNIWKKTKNKLKGFTRATTCMEIRKRKRLLNTFFIVQVNLYPLSLPAQSLL